MYLGAIGSARRVEEGFYVRVSPATPKRLVDLARFSEAYGKSRYCSCMRWRLASADYKRATKESRSAALHDTPPSVECERKMSVPLLAVRSIQMQ
jgi:hypothetical protein